MLVSSTTIQASSKPSDENLGLLANGASGSWEVLIDESVSGAERSFAQIEGPSFWLYFEIPSPDIIPKIMQFLRPPGTKREERPTRSSRKTGNLSISKAEETSVTLVRDDEYSDRCFIVIGRSESPIVRFSVAGEDLDNLVEALRQVEDEIRSSADSEEKTNGVVEQKAPDRTIRLPSYSGDYVSLWSFAGENLRLASRLLNLMCAHDFADVRIAKTESRFLKDKNVRYQWHVRSSYVRNIAVRLKVDSGSLRTFLEEQGFNPTLTVNPKRAQRDRWIEERWKWVGQ